MLRRYVAFAMTSCGLKDVPYSNFHERNISLCEKGTYDITESEKSRM